MSIARTTHQYRLLTRTLLFPTGFVRKLFLIMLLLPLGGAALLNTQAALAIATASSCILLFMIGLFLPGQMLALASSKQLRHLSDLRPKIFIIACLFWLSLTLLSCSALAVLEPKKFNFPDVATLAVFTVSLLVITFTVLMVYLPKMAASLPILLFFLPSSLEGYNPLNLLHHGYFWAGSVALWVGFYIWWTRWQPRKYVMNAMIMSPVEMQQRRDQSPAIFNRVRSAPCTLSGSLLTGASDALLRWIITSIVQPLAVILSIFIVLFLTNNNFFNTSPGFFLLVLSFVLTAQTISFVYPIYKNLYRLWINTEKSRQELFAYIERFYFSRFSIYLVIANGFILPLNYFVFNYPVDAVTLTYLLVIVLLFAAFLLYLFMMVYAKFFLNLSVLNWIYFSAYLAFIGSMYQFNIIWGQESSPHLVHYLAFAGVLSALTLALRVWAKAAWKRVNFRQVKY